MKWILAILNLFPLAALTQDKVLTVEGTTPYLFLNHTVQAKENFYSIGRLYNTDPKGIAPFNKIEMSKGLNPGQVLRIPLSENNFVQKNSAGPGEALIPLYYTVKEKEGLYRIGLNHNKISADALQKLNNLSSEAVNLGAELVVGFLKVKKGQSQLLTGIRNQINEKRVPEVVKNNSVIIEPVVNKPSGKEVHVVKTEVKLDPVVNAEEKKDSTVANNRALLQHFGGGFFKDLYTRQTSGKDTIGGSGTAGVFKSKSGRSDGKYYCLFNNASSGTIIKVTNMVTGNTVFAKVLDGMPDIKQNNGLLIQVSNAAADELGAGENNFKCTISYLK